MITAWIAPDPRARNIRPELLEEDTLDALAFALTNGGFTSAEVHRDAGLADLLHGNDRVRGHFGSSSLRYYRHHRDPEWAIIFNSDLEGRDAQRGMELLRPLMEQKG